MFASTTISRALVWCYVVLLTCTSAHMELSWPYPLRSKFNPSNAWEDIDYSMTSPLFANGSNFPCKGYQNDRPIQATAVFAAGSTYNLTLAGSVTHGGGSCQLSLSYDNGATFRVFQSMIGGCPLTSKYGFTIPSYVPRGEALLAWTWQNNLGNREFYMNCAQVTVTSRSHTRRQRQAKFNRLPFLWKANLEGVNDCATIEGEDPVYPSPGPDVLYGNSLNTISLKSAGKCDSPTPYGESYKSPGNGSVISNSQDDSRSSSPISKIASHQNANELSPLTSRPLTASKTAKAFHGPRITAPSKYGAQDYVPQRVLSVQISVTTTITLACESAITVTHTRTVTEAISNIAAPHTSAIALGTVTTTVEPVPPFATGDLIQYLPCVPRTFICTDASTWQTCDYNDGSISGGHIWVYSYPRRVAGGMACLPNLSPYAEDSKLYAQQSEVPTGKYRDDRIIRARPHGDCASDGSLQCTDGGQGFDICDQGGWIPMGSVAGGTVCIDGAIVAAYHL